jgi:Zn-dependent M28 family amino/carboxypeptidase
MSPTLRISLLGFFSVGILSCFALTNPEVNTVFDGARALADLEKMVGFGPRPSGSAAHRRTQEYLLAELEATGSEVKRDDFTAETPVGPIPMSNLIAVHQGETEKFVVFAGHYDTKRFDDGTFVGANDGGSSAALILELARSVARIDPAPKTTLWFVLLDGEEAVIDWTVADSLYGSRHMVARMDEAKELSRLAAFILVDMVGDRDLGIHREAYSTQWLQDLVWAEAKRLGHGEHFLDAQLYIEDDHIPFARRGVAVVDLIDFQYGPGHRYWHSPDDTLDKVSAESLQVVGETLLGVLARLDSHLSK